MEQLLPLFSESTQEWIQERRAALRAAADSSYHEALAQGPTDLDRAPLAQKIGWSDRFAVDLPRLVPGKAGVTLQPFQRISYTPGVDPVPCVRVLQRVEGDWRLCRFRPANVHPAALPQGELRPGEITVDLPDNSAALGDAIQQWRDRVALAVEQLSGELSLLYVNTRVGALLEFWRERETAERQAARQREKQKAALAGLGYAVR